MILVYAEVNDGIFKKSSLEAVAYAAQLASNMHTTCTAVCVGQADDAQMQNLAKYGADQIIAIPAGTFNAESYAKAIANIASSENAVVVVVSNTYSGKSVAPRIAARLKAAIVSGVVSQPELSAGFQVRRSVFSGKAFATVSVQTPVKVLALTPNSFTLAEQPKPVNLVVKEGGFTPSDAISQSLDISRTTGKVVLTEAEVVVSGGRGMKGPENWGMIEELASLLGAATACSKPVSDMDWRPHSEHVGQTGITIKPNLYIAVGISGAIQHLAGVSSSKVIVAINKDAEAPFFKAADYGIVGDAFEVLPKLIEAAKQLKGQHA